MAKQQQVESLQSPETLARCVVTTLKNRNNSAKICEKLIARAECLSDAAEKYFLIKIQKLKKGPLRGTPHKSLKSFVRG